MLAQRLYGRYLAKKSEELDRRIEEIKEGKYDKELDKLMKMDKRELSELYYSREIKL